MSVPTDQIRFDIFGIGQKSSGERVVIVTVTFILDAVKWTIQFWANSFDFPAVFGIKRLLNSVSH